MVSELLRTGCLAKARLGVKKNIKEETYRTVGWTVKGGWRFEQAGLFSLRPAEQYLDLVGAREEGWEKLVGQEQRLQRTIQGGVFEDHGSLCPSLYPFSHSQDEHTLGHLISHVSLSPTSPARSDPVHLSPPFPLLFFFDPMLMRRLGRVGFVWPSLQLRSSREQHKVRFDAPSLNGGYSKITH